jgi:small neutral amino acid transporter SnatA (MarC family)
VYSLAQPLQRLMGKAGSKTISKLASILLASIAIKMIRRGIIASLQV